MLSDSNIKNYKTALQEWLVQIQNQVQNECKGLSQYRDVEDAIDDLIVALHKNSFTNAQIDDVYEAIGDYQILAINAAYIIGLRDGIAAKSLIENMPVKDILEKSL